jgi:hypothetical protein
MHLPRGGARAGGGLKKRCGEDSTASGVLCILAQQLLQVVCGVCGVCGGGGGVWWCWG